MMYAHSLHLALLYFEYILHLLRGMHSYRNRFQLTLILVGRLLLDNSEIVLVSSSVEANGQGRVT